MTVRAEKRPGAGWNTWIFSYPLVSVFAIAFYLLAAYGLTNYSLEELE